MSYYQRPMGDYKTYGYAGDPGFLSSLWKGIKTVGKMLFTPALPTPGLPPPVYMPQAPAPSGFMPGVGARGPAMAGFRLPATGAGGRMITGPGAVAAVDGTCPVGYHLDKATRSRCVRNRRMNIANPRALRRSMRRVQGFEKLAKRTIRFTRRVKMKTKAPC